MVPVLPFCAGVCVPYETAADTESLAVQPDGKVLLGGLLRVGDTFEHRQYRPGRLSGMLIRLDGDGALDPSFGRGGLAEESPPIASHVFAPDGGYYYAVAVLRRRVVRYSASKPTCSVSSNMQRTSYGFPRADHWVILTLYPAPSTAGQWCSGGIYEGAVYAVPHKPKCSKQYPCYVAKAADCTYEVAERETCRRPVAGIVIRVDYYSYRFGLPKPIDSSTKIVGHFRLRFR